jgi:Fanconi anemia group M protein
MIKAKSMYEVGVEHPKLEELKRIVTKAITVPDTKILIFNQYRDSASKIETELNKIPGVSAKIFFGQAKKSGTGMSQKQQKEVVEQFSNNIFNVMVATSVAEEGLDIPKVDLVIFYEPIPSAIRHIQRRGRTGRLEKGSVIVLVTKGTRDEGYKWSAFHKEKRMKRTLTDMRGTMNGNGFGNGFVEKIERKDEVLARFINKDDGKNDCSIPEPSIKIFADDREKGNSIIKELIDLGIKIDLRRMEVGDYILSTRCAVEYKKVPDFVDSIIDGRLLQQVKDIKNSYDRPLIIVEGMEDIYSMRKIHPNAIRGMIATIAVSYGIPIIQTRTFKETANLLAVIAKREQEETSKNFNMHSEKKPMTLKELQEYIVSAFPGVGPGLAKPLLREFKTVKNIVNASEEDMKKIDKIGEKKAREIQKALNEEYKF